MYTVIVICTTESATTFYIRHFKKDYEAEQYTPPMSWGQVVAIYEGELSEDEAIAEYLD
jgi:hypothetical protein